MPVEATVPIASSTVRRTRRLVMQFGFAICDQALFAGTSFAFTVLLGRWDTPENFGAFSVAYSAFILVQNIFEGFVFEPLGVFGAGRFAASLDAYLGRVLIGHAFVAGFFGGLTLLLALMLQTCHRPVLAHAFFGLGLATPFLLSRIITRQPLYITGRVHWSVVTGAIYILCSVTALVVLRYFALVSPMTAYLALGFGSLIASLTVLAFLIRPVWRNSDPALAPRRLVADHLSYGRWAVGERLLLWFQANVLFFELPMFADLHASAIYRAISTLGMPAYLTISAIAGVLLPAAVRARHRATTPSRIWLFLPVAMGLAIGFCALLVVFGPQIVHFAYAGRYDADTSRSLLSVAGIGPVIFAACVAHELSLRAGLMVRQILIARIIASVVLLFVGTGLTAYGGVLGTMLALSMTWLTTLCAYVALGRGRAAKLVAQSQA